MHARIGDDIEQASDLTAEKSAPIATNMCRI